MNTLFTGEIIETEIVHNTTPLPQDIIGSITEILGVGGATNELLMSIIIFFWILVIIWTIKDSIYRSSSLLFQVCSVLLVSIGTPLVGLFIYLAIRPIGYKHERKYRQLIMDGYTIESGTHDNTTESSV